MTLTPSVRTAAIAACLCAALLLALAITTGGSQGMFQLYHAPDAYAELLRGRAQVLRLDLGIDMLFIASYGSFFLLWSRSMLQAGQDRLLTAFGLGLMCLTALLDAAENAHILAMLRIAEAGEPLSGGAIAAQQLASQVKFHAAYIGMALLGMIWTPKPGWTWIRLLFIAQLIAGLAIFVADGSTLRLLYLARALFFVVGPLLIILSAASYARPNDQRTKARA